MQEMSATALHELAQKDLQDQTDSYERQYLWSRKEDWKVSLQVMLDLAQEQIQKRNQERKDEDERRKKQGPSLYPYHKWTLYLKTHEEILQPYITQRTKLHIRLNMIKGVEEYLQYFDDSDLKIAELVQEEQALVALQRQMQEAQAEIPQKFLANEIDYANWTAGYARGMRKGLGYIVAAMLDNADEPERPLLSPQDAVTLVRTFIEKTVIPWAINPMRPNPPRPPKFVASEEVTRFTEQKHEREEDTHRP